MFSYDELRSRLLAKLRHGSVIYVTLAIGARAISALGMFIAIRRFAPSAFGEMAYLQATAATAVAFTSFGLELSINSRISRRRSELADLVPTVAAGCIMALAAILLDISVIVLFFSSQLDVKSSNVLATVSIGIYASLMINASLVNSVAFAFRRNAFVGCAHVLNALIFLSFAAISQKDTQAVDLLHFQSVAQFTASLCVAFLLVKSAPAGATAKIAASLFKRTKEVAVELSTLFQYGVKQILVVSVVMFSQWLIQRKIVFNDGGAADNAIYSVGNQIFNILTFLPTMLGPMIVTKFASAGNDAVRRQSLCIGSLKLFAAIAVGACAVTFAGLHFGIWLLPARYASCVETGVLAALAAGFQVIKAPFSIYFLSELKVLREVISSVAGGTFMIIALSLLHHVTPNIGTGVRLVGCALQAAILGGFFLIEYRNTRRMPPSFDA
jgi:O-antigen/teichoic acid export membrane protein